MKMRLVLSCLELGRCCQHLRFRPPTMGTRGGGGGALYSTSRSQASSSTGSDELVVSGKSYSKDDFTNVTPRILSHLGRNLHQRTQHPLGLIKQKIVNYMYGRFKGNRGNPLFSVHEQISPVVTIEDNFDRLLVPKDHVSRSKSDSYYINRNYMLRAHTSAHQSSLIQMGLDNFLVIGDVYRRDEIDSSHYPVFHQIEAVRLIGEEDLVDTFHHEKIELFECGQRTNYKQASHTMDAAKIAEVELKSCLVGLAKELFGEKADYRWVECYFPFTHPSWELEVFYNGDWLEVLGCGVMEQEILSQAGVTNKIGWAFGLGLERLAMVLYSIPDIRMFWSEDAGFLSQFEGATPETRIVCRAVSKCPPCTNDISFWLPQTEAIFSPNDFYDMVRSIGEDLVEQVRLVDEFAHPKTGRRSQCYRIVYRAMNRVLTQQEVNVLHARIEAVATQQLGVQIR